jgi:hypothetical protein
LRTFGASKHTSPNESTPRAQPQPRTTSLGTVTRPYATTVVSWGSGMSRRDRRRGRR